MNPMTDERLMAYADGELDPPEREAVERALQDDPALAERVRQMAGLRGRLQRGLDGELDEPVPERLTKLLGTVPAATVVDLAALRAQRAASAPPAPRQPVSTWWQWGGMAASVLVGVLIARAWPGADTAPPFAQRGGVLVASGAVAETLSSRLASEAAGAVAVPLSFVDRSGAYCRAFVLERSAGLACREGEAWVVQALATAEPAQAGPMRQAASTLPPALLQAVDARIAGDALDPTAERSARDRGWRR